MGRSSKQKQKHEAASTKPARITEDDADQEISDDGEVPTFDAEVDAESDSEGSESEDDEEDDGDVEMTSNPDKEVNPVLERPAGAGSAWKAPTTEEVANIRAATDLFKSNAFKLKIEALLPQIRPKPSSKTVIEPLLLALHEHLLSLPEIPPQHPLTAAKKLSKRSRVRTLFPNPEPVEGTNWKVQFIKPSNIQVVGGWPHGLTILGRHQREFGVDLAVEMPSTLFQEKDYLDSRFFHKRAFYLAVIAASLQDSSLDLSVSYDAANDNVRRSTLIIKPKPGSKYDFKKTNAYIRIIPTLASDSPIPLSRLSPQHSNLRTSQSPSSSSLAPAPAPASESAQHSTPSPTPKYNNDILLSTTPSTHLLLLHLATKEIPAFRDAVALLRLWANQRGYSPGGERTVVGFDTDLVGGWWAFLVLGLVWGEDSVSMAVESVKSSASGRGMKGRRTIGKELSSYQIFRAVLDFLGSHDFVKRPVRIRTPSDQQPVKHSSAAPSIPTFVGPSSPFNFLADVPISSLHLLAEDARTTLRALDSTAADSFEQVFMYDQRDLRQRFDVVMRLNLAHASLPKTDNGGGIDSASKRAELVVQLESVIRKALGARVRNFVFITTSSTLLPITSSSSSSSSPSSSNPDFLDIGIQLNPDHPQKLVEHGPPAEDPQACEAFRQFWGSKAELRRFNDGRVVESVVWELSGKVPNERLQLPGRIIRYIVGRHFGILVEDVVVFDEAFDGVLMRAGEVVARIAPSSSNHKALALGPEAAQRAILTAFDELVKDIKAIESLPLSLVNAIPIDENLRYTSPSIALPVSTKNFASLPDCLKYIPAMEVILLFEKSTRWPDDLEAIQKIKIAFLDAVAQALLTKSAAAHAVVAYDASANVNVNDNDKRIEDHVSLEVLLSSGYAFRLRIYHDREATLLERIIGDKRSTSTSTSVSTPEYIRKRAQRALEHHHRTFVSAPEHHTAILALHRRFPSYSHTVRLMKRWFAAHWLGGASGSGSEPNGVVSAQTVEILSALVYLDAGGGGGGVREVPSTGQSGFARCVALIAQWEFRENALFVPLYTAAGKSDDDLSSGLDSNSNSKAKEVVVFPSETRTKAEEEFKTHLAVDPSLSKGAWCLVTEKDTSGRYWSAGVTAVIASRAREVAKATVAFLRGGIASASLDTKAMFLHPTNDYDFVIHLNPSVVPRYSENIHAKASVWGGGKKYVNLMDVDVSTSVYGDSFRIDFDPVRMLVGELQRAYGDSLMLFYDPYGGTAIGGIWNPTLQTSRPFRVLLGFSSQPSENEQSKNGKKLAVSLNEKAILAEIERIGQGLITNITTSRES